MTLLECQRCGGMLILNVESKITWSSCRCNGLPNLKFNECLPGEGKAIIVRGKKINLGG